MIQWGTKASGTTNVPFHLAFSGSDTYYFNFIANKTVSTANAFHYYHTPTASTIQVLSKEEVCMWIAIGY